MKCHQLSYNWHARWLLNDICFHNNVLVDHNCLWRSHFRANWKRNPTGQEISALAEKPTPKKWYFQITLLPKTFFSHLYISVFMDVSLSTLLFLQAHITWEILQFYFWQLPTQHNYKTFYSVIYWTLTFYNLKYNILLVVITWT